nr:hypothetical protein [candidate division Zixibacteria bacterium]
MRILNIIYTNIGRGHPFYLDGVVDCLKSKCSDKIELKINDVFRLSKGIPHISWRFIRWLYRAGSQGGLLGYGYHRLRQNRADKDYSRAAGILARDIRDYVINADSPTLVAHPVLVGMIADLVPTFYQHGEIAVPPEAIRKGCRKIYVPLGNARDYLVSAGIPSANVIATGLCIEKGLLNQAENCFKSRISRIDDDSPLTGGFFSSGAEPREHVNRIILGARSLSQSGNRALIFCRQDGYLQKMLTKYTSLLQYDIQTGENVIEEALSSGVPVSVSFGSGEEENGLVSRLFRYLDFFVAPSHERSNWAAGLGLPMFILHPLIGTFSPFNRQFLIDRGVAVDLRSRREADGLPTLIRKLRTEGGLKDMANRGFGRLPLDGFETIADDLVGELMQA